ncbi:hypothetical protein Pelo_16421 [Pelomyxa schiedti]|nr:hypothetical protein Pelo_16421 [Pelomyxa schiedti]
MHCHAVLILISGGFFLSAFLCSCEDTGDGLDESDSVNYLQRHAMVVDVEECDISSESSEERECAKFTSSSLFEGLLELHKQGLLPKEPKHFLSTSEVEIGDIFTLELPAGVQKPLLSILPQGSFIRAQCHNNIGSYPTGSVLLSGPCTIIITSKFYWPEK